jgi:hypothetical protein
VAALRLRVTVVEIPDAVPCGGAVTCQCGTGKDGTVSGLATGGTRVGYLC